MPEAKAPTAEEGALADVERLVHRLLTYSLDHPSKGCPRRPGRFLAFTAPRCSRRRTADPGCTGQVLVGLGRRT